MSVIGNPSQDLQPSTDITPIPLTSSASSTTSGTPITTPNEQVNSTAAMTFSDVENIWIQAGGNPQAAAMAAAVADAESGLNPNATYTNPDGTTAIGLWLIPTNATPAGSTDPLANARAAIQQSSNGTNWQSWCSTWSDNNCGCDGGTYLGDGSDALASLQGQLGTASYNVIGSSPTGTGVSASAATSTPTSTSTTSSSGLSKYLPILAIVGIIVLVFFMIRRKTGESEESQSRSQASWTPDEESLLSNNNLSDKQLSQQTGRSVRAIRVRRNQLKG